MTTAVNLQDRLAATKSKRARFAADLRRAEAMGESVWAESIRRILAQCDAEILAGESAMLQQQSSKATASTANDGMLAALTAASSGRTAAAHDPFAQCDPAVQSTWEKAFARSLP